MTPAFRLGGICACALATSALTAAQPSTRKATTVSALLNYPVFYHAQRVVVRAEVTATDDVTYVAAGDLKVLCLACPTPAGSEGGSEVLATFWDVGRLEPNDPRLAGHGLDRLSERLLRKPWPGVGELLIVVAERSEPAYPPPGPSIRSVALEPERYEAQRVTLVGRFRGRNLYGDLPESPRQSRWDFVLQSGDGAVWITGVRPRGDDFDLDIGARVDTNRWLEVSGVVNHDGGLVWVDANKVALAQPPADPSPIAPPAPVQGPPPEVIFSAPTADEVNVARDTNIRIQFSRDMDPDSFNGRVRVGYLGGPSTGPGEPSLSPVDFTATYHAGNRFVEITFAAPLERFRTLRVELLAGIAAMDGSTMLKPWELIFTLGG